MHHFRLFLGNAIRCAVALLVILQIGSEQKVQAQCTAHVFNIAVSASTNKCGWNPCTNDSPPIVKYYLVDTFTESISASVTGYNSGETSTENYSLNETKIQTMDMDTRQISNNWSGTDSFTVQPDSSGSGGYGGSITNSTTGDWDAGGSQALVDGEGFSLEAAAADPDFDLSYTNICTPAASGEMLSGSGYTFGDGMEEPYSYYGIQLDCLSKEYTDQMLRAKMIGGLPPYPTDYSEGSGQAFYSLSDNHSSCSGGKMKYKFFLCGFASSQKGQQFKLQWNEVTAIPGQATNSIAPMSETVTGDGDPDGMWSSVHEVQVPTSPCTITETDASVTPISNSGSNSAGSGGQ